MYLSDKLRGLLLAVIGVLILSPDSLLIRLIDIDLWTLTFLRGSFMASSLLVLILILYKRRTINQFLQIDRYAWGIALLMAVATIFFVASIQTTSVAHTLIIVGAVPVVAAILGLFLLQQKLPAHTVWTIIIVLISLVFVVHDDARGSLLGDIFALITCLLMACIFILANRTVVDNMLAPMCMTGVLIALGSLPQLEWQSISVQQMLLSLLLGFLVGLALSMISLAPRFIPSAQVAIFMPLETVFGTLLVWWYLGEYPGLVSIIAGSIIVLALMLNSYQQLKPQKA